MGTPNSVANSAAIAALWAAIAAIWSFLNNIWGIIVKGWMVVVDAFMAWVGPLVTWLNTTVSWLLNLYNTWVKPTLEWAVKTVNWVSNALKVTRAALEGRIDVVFETLFGKVIELRDAVREGLTNLGSLVAIVNKDLGNKIIEQGQRFDFKILKMAQAVRSELLYRIDVLFSPLQRRVNEITAVIHNIRRQFDDAIGKITSLISTVIEKPSLLTKDTVTITGKKYGKELWDSMFETFPGEDITAEEARLKEDIGDHFAEANILEGIREYWGKWDDLIYFIDYWGDAVAGRPVAPKPPPVDLTPEGVEDLKPITPEEFERLRDEFHSKVEIEPPWVPPAPPLPVGVP